MLGEAGMSARDKLVERMQTSLAGMKRGDMPLWAATALMVPVVIGLMMWNSVAILFVFLFDLIRLPFVYLYLFFDLNTMIVWYTKRTIGKMTGRE